MYYNQFCISTLCNWTVLFPNWLWTLTHPAVKFDLSNLTYIVTGYRVISKKILWTGWDFYRLQQNFHRRLQWRQKVSAAAVSDKKQTKTVRLLDGASIYTAELFALALALGLIRKSNKLSYCYLLWLTVCSAGCWQPDSPQRTCPERLDKNW